MKIDVQVDEERKIGIVRVGGKLLLPATDQFRSELAVRIAPGSDIKRYVVDLSGVGLIDSAGIGALLSMARRVRELGGDIKLAALQSGPERIFDLIHAQRIFEIYSSVDEAVASFL